MTKCPHCGRPVLADRIGPGVAVGRASDASVVLGARCPYPHCARPVFARAGAPGALGGDVDGELALSARPDVASPWSPSVVARAVRDWIVPSLLVFGLGAVPASGFHEAFASARCGGFSWLFFAAGSLLALVPIIYFVRGLARAAVDALRRAPSSRLSASACGGLRLAPLPATYRSH